MNSMTVKPSTISQWWPVMLTGIFININANEIGNTGLGLHSSMDRCGKTQKSCNFSNTCKTFEKWPRDTEEPEHPLRSPSSNQTERMWGQIISATTMLRGAQRGRALVSTIQLPSSPSNKQTHTALCHPLRLLLLLLLMLLRNQQLALNQPNVIPPSSSFPG